MNRIWSLNPHRGGVKLTDNRKFEVKKKILCLTQEIYRDRCSRVEVRFRNQLCYIDAIIENNDGEEVHPLCRLRHFDLNRWSISLFTWSNEKYEPAIFPSGEWFGTLEECIHHGGVFLMPIEYE